jgi:putative ABC transport system permease protein
MMVAAMALSFREVISLSYDALMERKTRSILTMMMVMVGSSLMIALNGLSAGQSNFIQQQINKLAPNVLFVTSGQRNFRDAGSASPSIILNNVVQDRIRSIQYVSDAIPMYQGSAKIDAGGNAINTPVLGLDPQKIYVISPSLEMTEGSFIRSGDPSAMLVGDSIANPAGKTTAFVTTGQAVRLTYNYVDSQTGKQKTEARSFVVTGVIKPTGNNQIDRAVIIDPNVANSLFHRANKYDNIIVTTVSADNVESVQQGITDLYGDNIGIATPKAILAARQQFVTGNASFILGIALIALLVGAVGIVTTLYTSVTERVREIGTMKAIGAPGKFVVSLFLMEAIMIGIAGATAGLAAGVAGGYILTSGGARTGPGGPGGAQITPVFTAGDMGSVWALSVGLSILAGLYPAWKASRLQPIVALRRE